MHERVRGAGDILGARDAEAFGDAFGENGLAGAQIAGKDQKRGTRQRPGEAAAEVERLIGTMRGEVAKGGEPVRIDHEAEEDSGNARSAPVQSRTIAGGSSAGAAAMRRSAAGR